MTSYRPHEGKVTSGGWDAPLTAPSPQYPELGEQVSAGQVIGRSGSTSEERMFHVPVPGMGVLVSLRDPESQPARKASRPWLEGEWSARSHSLGDPELDGYDRGH